MLSVFWIVLLCVRGLRKFDVFVSMFLRFWNLMFVLILIVWIGMLVSEFGLVLWVFDCFVVVELLLGLG